MATTDPVKIVVDLVDNFSDEFEKIRSQLREIDRSVVDASFNIDDNGDIEKTYGVLEALDRERMNAVLNIVVDPEDLAKVESIRTVLGRDINANFDVSSIGAGSAFAGRAGLRGSTMSVGRWSVPMPQTPDMGEWRRFRATRAMARLTERVETFGKTLVKYRPSIMDWWQVLALLIPVLITLGAALIGAAAAAAGLATAAASLVGIGLLGWGDSASETMQELQREFNRLKEEAFAAISPVAQAFQPFSERFLRGIPGAIQEISDELLRMREFEEGLAAAGSGFIDWIEEGLETLADSSERVIQVALMLGNVLGDFIIGILQFGIRELYRHQEAYRQLGRTFINVIAILFNLSRVVTFVISQFGFLFEAVAKLTSWLSNKFVVTVLTAVTAATALSWAFANVALAFQALTAEMIVQKIAWIVAVIWDAVAATQTWVNSLIEAYGLLGGIFAGGIGLAVAGGAAYFGSRAMSSLSGPNEGRTGSQIGGDTVINVEGNVGRREMDRMLDHLNTHGSR